MNIDWFKDLQAVEKTGGFSKASTARFISQPALTRRIKALEQWAEQPLVDRGRRPVKLTKAGEELLATCCEFFETLEQQRLDMLSQSASRAKIVIRFTAQHSIAWHFFPNWLRELELNVGPISSRMRAEDLGECVASFIDEEVNFLLAYDTIEAEFPQQLHQSVDSIVIGTDQLVPVCALDSTGAPLFDCTHHHGALPLICYGGDTPLGRLFETNVMPQLEGRDVRVIYENSMSGTLLNWTLRGAGVCWLPHRLVELDLAQGRLALAGPPELSVDLKISIYSKQGTRFGMVGDIWDQLKATHSTPLSG